MAQLTDTLQSETRGKPVIEGRQVAPSIFGQLAGVAEDFITSLPQRQAAAAKAESDASLDSLAGALFQTQRDAAQARRNLPPGSDEALASLEQTRLAQEQGQIPRGSVDLALENVVAEHFNKYPEMRAEFAGFLKEHGYDHYLFRELQFERDAQDAEEAAIIAGNTKYYELAISRGADVRGDFNATVQIGRQIADAEAQLSLKERELEMSLKQAQISETERKMITEQTGADMVTIAIRHADTLFGPNLETVFNLVSAAGSDPEKRAKIDELRPQVLAAVEAMRHSMLSRLPDETSRKAWNDSIDQQIASFNNVFNANYDANKRTLDSMKTVLGINNMQAFKVYNQLSDLFGQSFVNQQFGLEMIGSLPPETREALIAEARGLNTSNVSEFRAALFSLGQVLKGDTQLMNVDPKQRATVLSGLAATVKGSGAELAKGTATPQDRQQYMNAYTQVLNVAVDIPIGTTDVRGIYNAVDLIVGRQGNTGKADSWEIFRQNANDPEFQPIIFGSRATAAKLLTVLQSNGQNTVGDWTLEVNADGFYEPKRIPSNIRDQVAIEAMRNAEDPFSPMLVPEDLFSPMLVPQADNVPPQLAERQRNLNTLVTHLVRTAEYDAEVPKGGTPKSLRRHYALGTPVVNPSGKPVVEPGMTFDEAVNRFKGKLQTDVGTFYDLGRETGNIDESFKDASISPGDAVSRFTGYGVPKHIAAGIVGNLMAESSLRTGAVGDGGKAMSLAQWHPDRRANAKANGFDLSDPQQAIDFVMWELNNTENPAKQRLMKARTVQEAADLFALYFLRPAGAQTGNANNVHNITGRRKYAQQVYGGTD